MALLMSVPLPKNAVESKLRGNPSDIGVTFREWLTEAEGAIS